MRTIAELRGDSALMLMAVSTYREALAEIKRESAPLEWAQVQLDMGNALLALGLGHEGPLFLEQAADAYEQALEVRTRDRVPLDWAMAKNNLGVALKALAKREKSKNKLEAAIGAFRDAASEMTLARTPLDGAMARGNLGSALLYLWEQKEVLDPFDADAAVKALMDQQAASTTPITIKDHQAALEAIMKREYDTEHLEAAITALRASADGYSPTEWPAERAEVLGLLGYALVKLDPYKSEKRALEEAISVHTEQSEIVSRENWPYQWGSAKADLAYALYVLGRRTRDSVVLRASVSAFEESLTVDRGPRSRVNVTLGMLAPLNELANLSDDETYLFRAISACRETLLLTGSQIDPDLSHSLKNALQSLLERTKKRKG
jgi:tetratricopeptide (TPR) repeat protein